ncbi:signal peptidase I [Candidatus Latescibacterota bacterium]
MGSDNKDSTKVAKQQRTGFRKFLKEWVEPIVVAFVLVTIFKMFFFQNFKIPSGSMEDTLLIGDYLFAAKFTYGTKIPFTKKRILKFREPKQGDIIIFESPSEPDKDLIKRCVAVGGQTVEIRDKQVFVDGIHFELPEHGKFEDSSIYPGDVTSRDNIPKFSVPEGMLFMMGDNRDNSNDSRFWGFLPEENIKGKALFLYWSWDSSVMFFKRFLRVRWSRIFDLIR